MHISESFQLLIRAAIDGHYDHPFFDSPSVRRGGYPRRLRAVVQNLNLGFAELARKKGHRFEFVDTDTNAQKTRSGLPMVITRAKYRENVRTMMRECRGRELHGLFGPLLVGKLFREQAEPWRGFVEKHVKDVWEASKRALELILFTLTDENTYSALMLHVLDPFMSQTLTRLNSKLDKVLKQYEELHAMTYNHYFTDTLQKARIEQFQKSMTENFRVASGNSGYISDMSVEHLVSIVTPSNTADMEIYAASELAVCMEAYYNSLPTVERKSLIK